jgi:hypothetical protein
MNLELTIQRKQTFKERLRNSTLLLLLLPVLLPLVLVPVALFFLYRITLYLLIWILWLPRGKDILLVYFDCMFSEVLPLCRNVPSS